MDFQLLGPVSAWTAAGEADLGPARQRCVLAALLLASGPVGTEALIGRLWGEDPPVQARSTLFSYVSRLRRILTSVDDSGARVLERTRDGYLLRIEADRVDLRRARSLARDGQAAERAGDDARACELLRSALDSWRQPALAGLAGAWAERARAVIARERSTLLHRRFALELRLGREAEAVDELAAAVAAQPMDERLAEYWMLALDRCGRQAEAVAAYAQVRERIAEELGAEPGGRLTDLHTRILRRAATAPAVPRSAPMVPLFGRDAEIERVAAAVTEGRTVHLCGAAGVGKTALASAVARRLAQVFPDGPVRLSLRSADGRPLTPAETAAVVADAAGDTDGGLLVVDDVVSVEQVRPLLGAAAAGALLLIGRPRLRGLAGVETLTLEELTVPASRKLFLARVGRTGGEDTEALLGALGEVCGGNPLALLAVAAQARSRPAWTDGDLLVWLRTHEGELGGGVETVLAEVHAGLGAAAGRVYAALGHIGELDAAAAVALTGLPVAKCSRLLEDLVDANTLVSPAAGRYRLPSVARWHARGLRPGSPHPVEVLAAHYLALAADEGGLPAAKRANVPALIEAATVHCGPETALRLATAIEPAEPPQAWIGGYEAIMEAGGHMPPTALATAANNLGLAYLRAGRHHEARHRFQAALAAAGPEGTLTARVRNNLGNTHRRQGRWREAEVEYRAFLDASRRAGDRWGEAAALTNLAATAAGLGDWSCALDLYTRALHGFTALGDDRHEQAARAGLAALHVRIGGYPQAMRHHAQILASRHTDQATVMGTLCGLARLLHALGDHTAALGRLQEALPIAEELGDTAGQAGILNDIGQAYRALGRRAEAAAHHRRALELADTCGLPVERVVARRGLAEPARPALDHGSTGAGRRADRATTP